MAKPTEPVTWAEGADAADVVEPNGLRVPGFPEEFLPTGKEWNAILRGIYRHLDWVEDNLVVSSPTMHDAAASFDDFDNGALIRVADMTDKALGDEVTESTATGYTSMSFFAFDTDGRYLYNRKGSTDFIEVRDMETLEPVDPVREFETSFSGSTYVFTNGDYLIAQEVGGSGDVDIWDLSDDSFVGTYTPGGAFRASCLGKGNTYWVVTATGTNGEVELVDLTTAAAKAGYTNYGLSDPQGTGADSPRCFADDYFCAVINDTSADEIETVDYTGTKGAGATGTGSGTTIESITGDNRGWLYMINGAYIQKLPMQSLSDSDDGAIQRLHGVGGNARDIRCDGRYVYLAGDSTFGVYRADNLERVSRNSFTGGHGEAWDDYDSWFVLDGMDLIMNFDDGAGSEGFRRLRGPNLSRLVQKRPGSWIGQSPLFCVASPIEGI